MEINDLRKFDRPRLGFLREARPFRSLHPRANDRSSQFQRTRAGAPHKICTTTFRREYKSYYSTVCSAGLDASETGL